MLASPSVNLLLEEARHIGEPSLPPSLRAMPGLGVTPRSLQTNMAAIAARRRAEQALAVRKAQLEAQKAAQQEFLDVVQALGGEPQGKEGMLTLPPPVDREALPGSPRMKRAQAGWAEALGGLVGLAAPQYAGEIAKGTTKNREADDEADFEEDMAYYRSELSRIATENEAKERLRDQEIRALEFNARAETERRSQKWLQGLTKAQAQRDFKQVENELNLMDRAAEAEPELAALDAQVESMKESVEAMDRFPNASRSGNTAVSALLRNLLTQAGQSGRQDTNLAWKERDAARKARIARDLVELKGKIAMDLKIKAGEVTAGHIAQRAAAELPLIEARANAQRETNRQNSRNILARQKEIEKLKAEIRPMSAEMLNAKIAVQKNAVTVAARSMAGWEKERQKWESAATMNPGSPEVARARALANQGFLDAQAAWMRATEAYSAAIAENMLPPKAGSPQPAAVVVPQPGKEARMMFRGKPLRVRELP